MKDDKVTKYNKIIQDNIKVISRYKDDISALETLITEETNSIQVIQSRTKKIEKELAPFQRKYDEYDTRDKEAFDRIMENIISREHSQADIELNDNIRNNALSIKLDLIEKMMPLKIELSKYEYKLSKRKDNLDKLYDKRRKTNENIRELRIINNNLRKKIDFEKTKNDIINFIAITIPNTANYALKEKILPFVTNIVDDITNYLKTDKNSQNEIDESSTELANRLYKNRRIIAIVMLTGMLFSARNQIHLEYHKNPEFKKYLDNICVELTGKTASDYYQQFFNKKVKKEEHIFLTEEEENILLQELREEIKNQKMETLNLSTEEAEKTAESSTQNYNVNPEDITVTFLDFENNHTR